MRTLVIGANGNMGRRYISILKYLGEEVLKLDTNNINELSDLISIADRFIIATPTNTHLYYIKLLLKFDKPILCEKPLSMDIEGLKEALEQDENSNLFMVNNYSYAYHLCNNNIPRHLVGQDEPSIPDLTYYNFYNSGQDGLIWDCIQLIDLSIGPVVLKNNSPLWECIINGVSINRSEIDRSYLLMIADFVGGFVVQDREDYIRLHEEVEKMNDEFTAYNKSEYWSPGTNNKQKVP